MSESKFVSPSYLRQRLIPNSPAGFFRAAVDVLIITSSILVSVVLRLVWMILREGYTADAAMERSFTSFGITSLVLIPISIVTFAAFGFYTYGRSYQSRYKFLTVLKGVGLAGLIASLVVLLIRDNQSFSRGVLIASVALSGAGLLLVRLGSQIWADLKRTEHKTGQVSERPRRLQRVLVIGGAGYIGSALIPQLLMEGYRVRVFDRMIYGESPIKEYLNHPRVEVVRADFRQVDQVVQALHDVDCVVHLGAIVGDPACALDEDITTEINLVATRMIAEVAKGLGIRRFVFASTCSVYGASDELLDEQSSLNPVSLYAKTKIACEQVLLNMQDEQFHPTILRFATIYGLSGRTRFDLVVNLLTAKAHFDGEITVSGGDQWRPFVHVSDAAKGVMKAMEAPLEVVSGQIYNIGGNEENYTIGQAAEIINEVVPTAVIKDIPFDGDRRNYKVRFDKAEKQLRFRPDWFVGKGVRQVNEAIQSGKIKSYRDPEFSNVVFLKSNGLVGSLMIEDTADDIDKLIASAHGPGDGESSLG